MSRKLLVAAAIAVPLLLVAVAWQAGRFATLAAQARRVEAAQESWLEENRKLDASVRVLSSREKAEERALLLGLEKAGPEQRLRIEGAATGAGAGATGAAATAGGATSSGGGAR